MTAEASPVLPPRGFARGGLLTAAVGFLGVAAVLLGSWQTGPSIDEVARLVAVDRGRELIRAFVDSGPMVLGSSSARTVFGQVGPHGPLPAFLTAWVAEVGLLGNALTVHRLGWLLVTATAPLSVFLVVRRGQGPFPAVLAALLLLGMPRWLHAASLASEAAVVGSLWLLILAAHVTALPPTRRRALHGVLLAGAIGLGVAISLGVLWAVGMILAQHLWDRRATARRTLARGRLPVPAGVLWGVFLVPVLVLAFAPEVWRGPVGAAEWLVRPLRSGPAQVTYGTSVFSGLAVPRSYAVHWLAATTPALVCALAIAGVALLARDTRDRRDSTGLLLFVLVGVVGGALGPLVAPRALLAVPPRGEAILPFLAMAGGVGLARIATRFAGARRGALAGGGVAVAAIAVACVGLKTASAAYALQAGTERLAATRSPPGLGDGSEIAVLAPAIDALGEPAPTVHASGVPKELWTALHLHGRTRARVEGVTEERRARYLVVRGARTGALAVVERRGAVLWSLVRR